MRGRNIPIVVVSGLVTLLLLATPGTAGVLDRMKETGAIRIGYRVDARPHSYADGAGRPNGYIIDVCREVVSSLQRAQGLPAIRTEYVAVPATARFESVRSGQVDLLCEASSITMSRRQIVDFSLPTYVDGAGVLSKRGVPIQSFEDFSGKRVGVLVATTTEQALRESLAELNIKADIRTVTDHREGAALVASGQIDAYVGDRSILSMMLYQRQAPQGLQVGMRYFSYETYALALPRGDDAFRFAVDRTLARLFRSGRMEELIKKNFGTDPDDVLRTMIAMNAVPD